MQTSVSLKVSLSYLSTCCRLNYLTHYVGTGFLHPQDLIEFDLAMDEYLNGEFYNCPSNGKEIITKLVNLRNQRENNLYLIILEIFLSILKKTLNKPGNTVVYMMRCHWFIICILYA